MTQKNWMLLTAGAGSLAISLLHIAIPFLGPWGYAYFGAAELVPLAQAGSSLPAALTWVLAAFFAVLSAYAISAGINARRLPALSLVLGVAAVLFLLRGLAFFPEAARLLEGNLFPQRRALFSGVSLVLGCLYAGGLGLLRFQR